MDWQGVKDMGEWNQEKETLAAGRPVISILLQMKARAEIMDSRDIIEVESVSFLAINPFGGLL